MYSFLAVKESVFGQGDFFRLDQQPERTFGIYMADLCKHAVNALGFSECFELGGGGIFEERVMDSGGDGESQILGDDAVGFDHSCRAYKPVVGAEFADRIAGVSLDFVDNHIVLQLVK